MPPRVLDVAVLWHMHQPDYVDAHTGRAVMPWVRLHALLSYYDTLRVVGEVSGARATFNLVPILVRQLADLVEGKVQDDFLALATPAPGELSTQERALLLKHCFAFNHGRRFPELPRLGELWRKRNLWRGDFTAAAAGFDDQELLDLQVGFHLAWSGRTLREHDLVVALLRKGMNFTPQEKADLLRLQREFLARIVPAYREAAAGGLVELSCTPYSHPILPLLCDTRVALQASPDLTLPRTPMLRPGDAWYQVHTGLVEMERQLGLRPSGMWPAEGAVSEEALQIFAAEDLRWVASDQDVLTATLAGKSLPAGAHFRPFRWTGAPELNIFFRDKDLSNRIGFVYASWPTERAVADLVGRLQAIRRDLPAGRFIVPIILDGENPWENYAENGIPFLTALYQGVAAAKDLRWTTFGEFLAREGADPALPLTELRAGSWIRSDLTTWIGHPEKNAAWDRLAGVREWLQEKLEAAGAMRQVVLGAERNAVPAPDPERVDPAGDSCLTFAWRAMVAAESSDWFWWYGDDHSTDFALEFDFLFRSHLANVYRHLGSEPDPLLQQSLLTAGKAAALHPPRFPLSVKVDGRVSNYFEWLDAGWCEPPAGGAMHREDAPVSRLYYGGDTEHLYLRIDLPPGEPMVTLAGVTVEVRSGAAGQVVAALRLPEQIVGPGRMVPAADSDPVVTGAFDQIIEIAVPWRLFGVAPDAECAFSVVLDCGQTKRLVLPAVGHLELRVPLGWADTEDWLV